MTSHELARQLLELPEDTLIVYNEEGKLIDTLVRSIRILNTNLPESDPMHMKIKELIKMKRLVSTYVVLNPSNN